MRAFYLSGNSKQYLGKEYTEQQINEMDSNNINILLHRYESVLSAQMTKSLGKSVINLYSNIACLVLGVGSQQDLSNDLESDSFLDTALQRLTWDLYYRFGAFLSSDISWYNYWSALHKKILALNYMENQKTETVTQQEQETVTEQKNPLRIEKGKKLVEYNRRKKEELKHLNEHITKQDDMIECKPVELSNNYLYISGVSVVGLAAIAGYLLYNKPEQNLIGVPPVSNVSNVNTEIELKRDIFEMY